MGDYVYAFSALGVTIHSTSDLTPIQELDIPGHVLPDWYYYEEDGVEESESEGSDDGSESSSEDSSETHPCNEPDAQVCED